MEHSYNKTTFNVLAKQSILQFIFIYLWCVHFIQHKHSDIIDLSHSNILVNLFSLAGGDMKMVKY